MHVRGVGVRDIAEIEKISIVKVLSVLTKSHEVFTPKQNYYDEIEVDGLWTYVGNKKRKLWLFYAYYRATGEIIAWVWGKRNYKTVLKLREKIKKSGVTFGTIYTDDFSSFEKTFKSDNHTYNW
jgi:transposase-like protein